MTKFIQGSGSVINCDTCFEQTSTKISLLYEVAEAPAKYSCEILNKYAGVLSCPNNICPCEDGLPDYAPKSRTAACKNEYCVPQGGYVINDYGGWNYDRNWSSFGIFVPITTLLNVDNFATWCSNNYHKENISAPLPFEKNIEYDFEIILETYEIDMETYVPGYVCAEEQYIDNPDGFPLQGPIFDFIYRQNNCHVPDVNCADINRFTGTGDPLYKNQGACSKLSDPEWTEVAKELTAIQKIYSYSDCSRSNEYCEECTPDSSCWPLNGSDLYNSAWGEPPWYYRLTLINSVGNLNTKCCSRTQGNDMHTFSGTINGMRSPKCGSGIVEEYECVSNYKTLKCINGEVKTSDSKENAGLCASCDTQTIQNGPYIPQDKKLDVNNKIKYTIKQNQTIEQTITTYIKTDKQPNPSIEAIKKDPLYPNSALQMVKTKYIEAKTVDNYKITVTFAYCKGTPKPC